MDQFHAVHGGDRFPVDVEALIREVPGTFQTGEPITIQGEAMDPEFEGALFNLNADAPGKGNWAIIYNQAISCPGEFASRWHTSWGITWCIAICRRPSTAARWTPPNGTATSGRLNSRRTPLRRTC
ncbi:hypothetical protein [Dechloromonas sp.]|uniref:hypothetical protein n=1 Tax=Dechloromonas sp. TaxID=1917218 RepID=UPI00263F8AFB|nr:hypothetical protein [Dechloromonas sp.]